MSKRFLRATQLATLTMAMLIAAPAFGQLSFSTSFTNPVSSLGRVVLKISFVNNTATNYTNLIVNSTLPTGFFKSGALGSTCLGESDNVNTPGNFLTVKVSLNANSSCFVNVDLIATTLGVKQVTVSGAGDLGGASVIEITIVPPVFTKSFSPNTIAVGQISQLTFTITNTFLDSILGSSLFNIVAFTDTVPDGLTPGQVVFNNCPAGPLTITANSITYSNVGDFPARGICSIVINVTGTTVGVKNNTAALAGQTAFGSLTVVPPADSFQVRYASNLTAGDSVINITNTGVNGAPLNGPGFGGAAGNTCVNVYAFSPDEQLISCCSCLITPNGLVSLSVNQDLISNTLTGVRPNSVVVKLVNTGAGPTFTGTSCTNSAAGAGTASFPLAGGMAAFGTSIHAAPAPGTFQGMETPFVTSPLSPAELASITNRCINIVGNGSSFGICRSCRVGGLSAGK